MKIQIDRIDSFKSKKGNDCFMAWFHGLDDSHADISLPCKWFCPDWVKAGMTCGLRIVPDFRCNASFEFFKL